MHGGWQDQIFTPKLSSASYMEYILGYMHVFVMLALSDWGRKWWNIMQSRFRMSITKVMFTHDRQSDIAQFFKEIWFCYKI